jgi:hypothetical protein
MFWIYDISQLFKPVLIPTDYMTIEEKLNTLTRLIIFICIILALILQEVRIILLMIILVIVIIVIYNFQNNYTKGVDSFLNENNLQVVDNSICTKPTKDNPFMNPTLTSIGEDSPKACPITNKQVAENIDDILDSSIFKNVDDIYDRSTSKRQFYTVPGNKIPNDQTTFANWLYGRAKSCKEENGDQCYKNIYTDLRMR